MRVGGGFVLGFLSILVAAAANTGSSPLAAILAVFVGIPLVCLGVLATVLVTHELAHAVVARALGFRVFVIRLGSGPVRLRFTIGPFPIEIRRIRLAGEVVATTRAGRLYRTRTVSMVLAGPIVSGLLGWAAYVYSAPPHSLTAVARDVMLVLSLWVFIASFLPAFGSKKRADARQPRKPDGPLAMSILRYSDAEIDEIVRSYDLHEAADQVERGEFEAALRSIDDAEQAGAPSSSVLLMRSLPLISLGRYGQAREELLGLVDADDVDAAVRALAANNIAWVDVLAGDARQLDEADVRSKQALELDPTHLAFVGTRGAVLVELGEIEEGIDHLERSFAAAIRSEDRALTHAWLAIGEARRGNMSEAKLHEDAARRAHPECVMLARAVALSATGAARA